MAHYMLAAHTREGEPSTATTPEDRQHSWEQIGRLEQEMKAAGVWVFSARLHEPSTATVVRSRTARS